MPASTAMSTPCACGEKNSGVAQVLSAMTQAPRACAAAAMAGMSCTSSDCEPGDSTNTALVLGRISAAIPAPIERIVIGGLDAHALQRRVAEDARRLVGRVGHQQMIAGARARSSARRRSPPGPRGPAPFPPRRKSRSRLRSAPRWSACRACRRCSAACGSSASRRRERARSSRETAGTLTKPCEASASRPRWTRRERRRNRFLASSVSFFIASGFPLRGEAR